MKAKFTLLARVATKFQMVEIRKGVPVAIPDATSYYARYTDDEGKRQCRPLGKDLQAAYLTFANMEIAKDYRERNLPVPESIAVKADAPPAESFRSVVDRYCDETYANKARKTYLAYKNTLRMFQRSSKRTTLAEVTRLDILGFKGSLRGEGFSERSVYNNFLNLMIFLKWAAHNTGIKKTDWPRCPEREPEAYTDEEITALLNAASDEERLILNCLLCSGLRLGELCHLTYGDVDFRHSVWTVQPKEGWAMKTENAQRDVPVPTWLTEKIRERQKKTGRGLAEPLFSDGTVLEKSLLRVIKKIGKRAGLKGRVDAHKFRSTAITMWLRQGNTVPDVMKWVGHANPDTILRYAEKINVRNSEFHKKATGAFEQFNGVGD